MTSTTDAPPVDGEPTNRQVTRRSWLQATAAAGSAAALGATAQSAGAADGDGGDIGYGGWFDETGNFESTADERGAETVRISVGAEGNGGNFAFDPPAVQVDPGTRIVWEWSGEGSSHDVVAESGAFASELVQEAGHTFEWTAAGNGITKYACTPHRAMGMRGAVVVGQPDTRGPSTARVVGDSIVVLGSVGLGGGLLALVVGNVLRGDASDADES